MSETSIPRVKKTATRDPQVEDTRKMYQRRRNLLLSTHHLYQITSNKPKLYSLHHHHHHHHRRLNFNESKMFPLIQPVLRGQVENNCSSDHMHPNSSSGVYGQRVGGDPCLVLTSDPKPRLRWTADLHDSFVDAVTQLGGPNKATPKAIMRTMSVKGLTLFHLKSHLQKYRLGKQSAKEFDEASKDGFLLDSSRASNSPKSLQASDMNEGYEVKEALRAQMEVQSKLHLQVEAEKHLQIRQAAEKRYMAMLERACKMVVEQIIGTAVTNDHRDGYQGKGSKAPPNASHIALMSYPFQSGNELGIPGSFPCSAVVSPKLHPQWADCSTEILPMKVLWDWLPKDLHLDERGHC